MNRVRRLLSAGILSAGCFGAPLGCHGDKPAEQVSDKTAQPTAPAQPTATPPEAPPTPDVAAPVADPPPAAPPVVDARPPSAAEILLAKAEYQYDADQVAAACREEWTKRGELNTEMFESCQKRQREGYDKIAPAVGEHPDWDWVPDELPKIWKHWTKRKSTNYEMVASTLAEEIDNYLTYQYESNQPSGDKAKLKRCLAQRRQWSKDVGEPRIWWMTMNCYKDK